MRALLRRRARLVPVLLAAGLSAGLVACGGGGNGGGEQAAAAGSRVVTGAVSKGPLRNATVSFYALNIDGTAGAPVGSPVSTDASGHFTATLPTGADLLARSSDGDYLDESDPAGARMIALDPGEGLEGIVPDGASTLALTPYSHALVLKARREAGGANFLAYFAGVRAQATSALGFDAFTVLPANPMNPAGGGSPAYAMALGGAAQAINAMAIESGNLPDYEAIQAFIDDYSDGELDGLVDGATVNLHGSPIPTTLHLNDEIARFRNNNFSAYSGTSLLVINEAVLMPPATVANQAPVAIADTYPATEDTVLSVAAGPGVLANDIDSENDALTATLVSSPPAGDGSLSFSSNGSFTFTPVGNFNGSTSFTYRANDGAQDSSVVTVTINVAAVNDAPTGSVTISDTTPAENQVLTATDTVADQDGLGTITYTWQRADDLAFTTNVTTVGTGSTFAPGDLEVGRFLRVTAGYTDLQGNAEAVSSAVSAAVTNVNDNPTGSVTIDDTTPAEDQLLTASNTLADADGLGTITYTWRRADNAGFTAGIAIVGTGSTFTPGDSEVGKFLRVTASYTDGQGTNEADNSPVTAAVTNVNDAPTGTVTIDDATPSEDQLLTAANTLADADGLGTITYAWKRADDAAFTTNVTSVGTGSTFTPGDADEGKFLRVTASYTDARGTAESVDSAVTAAVINVNDAPTGTVTIDDTTPTEDQLLTAANTLADNDGLGAITYGWQRADDAAFTTNVTSVGTGSTFTPGDSEVGKFLRVTASYTDGNGSAESVSSAVTAAVTNLNDAPTGSVTIDDTSPDEDQLLTAANTLADNDGLGAITYTWKRADDAGFTTNVTDVGTGTTFTPGDAEEGKFLRVVASYTDNNSTGESVASAVTAAVANVNDAPTGAVTIDDATPDEDQLLTAANTLADNDGLGAITYTWKRADDAAFTVNVTDVGTGGTFTPGDAEEGKFLRVVASYTDGNSTAESVASAVTAAVANVNDAPTGTVTIDDTTPDEDQLLTAANTLADNDGLGAITYTWKRADDAAFTVNVTDVGTGGTFTPGDAEEGKFLRVVASYTDGNTTAESVASAVTAAVANVNDAPTGAVTIDDATPDEDQLLTTANTLADNDGLGAITYTWKRADDAAFTVNVTDVGTGPTFTPGDAEVGKFLRVAASYTDGNSTSESVASAVTAAVANVNDTPAGTVTIDDTTPDEDQLLTAANTLADDDGLGAITYTWKRADDAAFTVNVTDAGTGATFTPGDAEEGKFLRVVASYTDGNATAESVASAVTAAVANVNDTPTGTVTIDDTTPTEDQLLTAANTLADNDGLGAITYTWKRADDAAFTVNVTDVGTGPTFTPGDAEVGKFLRVTASYTDGNSTAESVASAVTAAVINVNDPPTSSNDAATTAEDTTLVLGAGDFGTYVDTELTPLASVEITTLESDGSLEYDTSGAGAWAAVTLNQVVSAADLGANRLRFVPDANENGAGYASIGFKVSDGTDPSAAAYVLTINVTAADDAPVANAIAPSVAEDSPTVVTLSYSDPEGNLATACAVSSLANVTESTACSCDGAGVCTVGITGTPLHYNGAASFSYTVTANALTSNSAGATITITEVNDAPSFTNINGDNFAFEDDGEQQLSINGVSTGGGADEASQTVTFTALSDNTAVVPHPTVDASGVNRVVHWTPAPNRCGSSIGFTISGTDDGTTGGLADPKSTATFSGPVDVVCVNDAPAGTSNTVTTSEDVTYTFAAADFGFTDPSDTPANSLQGVKITTLPAPAGGVLKLASVPVTAGDTILAANIPTLTFEPAADANGAGIASFTFQVQDNGGTANSGVDLDPSANTITVNVTAVNDPPVQVTNAGLTIDFGDPATAITTAELSFDDLEDGDGAITYTVTFDPPNGDLQLMGFGTLGVGDTFSEADVVLGFVTYLHDGSATTTDSFDFYVTDGDGAYAAACGGGPVPPALPCTFAITITAPNQAPALTVPAIPVRADPFATTYITGISTSDPDAGTDDVQLVINLNGAGQLTVCTNATGGVTAPDLTNNGTGVVTITATTAEINATFADSDCAAFTQSTPKTGATSVSVNLDDLGNNGAGGALTDSDAFEVRVNTIDLANAAAVSRGSATPGVVVGGNTASQVARAGDVNGDGIDDLVIGALTAASNVGKAYVVFGTPGGFPALNALNGSNGVVLEGTGANAFLGAAVAGIGDINCDGLDDVAVGAPNAAVGKGAAYVLYGRSGGYAGVPGVSGAGVISTASYGASGFFEGGYRVEGEFAGDSLGYSVSTAGDLEGDGCSDLLIGAPNANGGTGAVYVVLDGTEPGDNTGKVQIADLDGSNGFAILGEQSGDQLGFAVAGGGDVNGDGIGDIVLGAPYVNDGPDTGVGAAYVMRGQASYLTASVLLSDFGDVDPTTPDGYRLLGEEADDNAGYAVSIAGDFNGDHLADVSLGAWGYDPFVNMAFVLDVGRTYLVFGPEPASLVGTEYALPGTMPASDGLVVLGMSLDADSYSGTAVSNAGDVNGDGLDDLLIGAYNADGGDGHAALVFGSTTLGGVQAFDNLDGQNGVLLEGSASSQAGAGVWAGGDFNGDGFQDIVVGAPTTSPQGAAYVVHGFDFTGLGAVVGTSGNDVLNGSGAAQGIIGGAGDDTLGGAGGADALYGGRDDDTLTFQGTARRADGGPGWDVLALPAGATDLSTFNSGTAQYSVLRNFEAMSLNTDAMGARQLDLDASDVRTMTSVGAFGHLLVVDGAIGDELGSSTVWDLFPAPIDVDGSHNLTYSTAGGYQGYTSTVDGRTTALILDRQVDGYEIPFALGHAAASTDATGSFQNGASYYGVISGNGQYVFFASGALNLVSPAATDTQVYRKDISGGTVGPIDMVSTTAGGLEGNGPSYMRCSNYDGTRIGFFTSAANIAGGGNHLVVKDLTSGAITVLSAGFTSVLDECALSADGRYAVFIGSHPGQASGAFVAWRRDLDAAGPGDIVSGANCDTSDSCLSVDISADGRYVVYGAEAAVGIRETVFRYDTATASTLEAVPVTANGHAHHPTVSANGNRVTYESEASNIVPGDTNGRTDIFVADFSNGNVARINTPDRGGGASDTFISNNQASDGVGDPEISDDGRFVTFSSGQAGIGPISGADVQVFVKELPLAIPNGDAEGRIVQLARNDVGDLFTPNEVSSAPTISFDGQFVAFNTDVNNVIASLTDGNGLLDVIATRNPWYADSTVVTGWDTDGDGLTDKIEILHGDSYPWTSDSDGDGFSDLAELGADGEYNPGVDTSALSSDTDNDGVGEALESQHGTDARVVNTSYYVDAGATGSNNGTSWANAYTDNGASLTTALGAGGATAATAKYVLYAPGIYAALDLTGVSNVILIGSMGSGVSAPTDPEDTRFSGGLGTRPLTTTGTGVKLNYLQLASGALTSGNGGGLLVSGGAVEADHLSVSGNQAVNGGGIAIAAGSLTLTNGHVYGNRAYDGVSTGGGDGGGLYVATGAAAIVYETTFRGNNAEGCISPVHAGLGGGIAVKGTLQASFMTLASNWTGDYSSGSNGGPGGGLYTSGNGSQAIVVNSRFLSNFARTDGGGFYFGTGTGTAVDFRNNLFVGNVVEGTNARGGAATIGDSASRPVFHTSTVAYNMVDDDTATGGGLVLLAQNAPSAAEIHDNIFWGNRREVLAGTQVDNYLDEGGGTAPAAIFDYNADEDGDDPQANPSNFDPKFTRDFYLDLSTSPLFDAGDPTAMSYVASPWTTRIDGTVDTGTVDLGYHHRGASAGAVTSIEVQTPVDLGVITYPSYIVITPKLASGADAGPGLLVAACLDDTFPDHTNVYLYSSVHPVARPTLDVIPNARATPADCKGDDTQIAVDGGNGKYAFQLADQSFTGNVFSVQLKVFVDEGAPFATGAFDTRDVP